MSEQDSNIEGHKLEKLEAELKAKELVAKKKAEAIQRDKL